MPASPVPSSQPDGGRSVVGNRGGDDLLDGRGRLVDDGVESVVDVGGVVDGADRTVGLNQRVLALDDISVALLGLRLDVSGMRVLDAVVERVFRVRSNTYNRLGNDVLQHRSMDGHRGVDQGVGSIVAVFNRRRTDGDGEQSNGNEALQWKKTKEEAF
uniref:Uncharacterized protein n=1 Tax=Anopheles melas TaxID=34690 RepID=A0A182TZL9_9DIPT